LIILLSLLSCLLGLLLVVSVYYNFKFAKIIFRVEDSIESSLDVLDQGYRSISDILERPVFFDSLEVRQVITDITKVRNSILHVAEKLTSIDEKIENDDQSEEN